MDSIAIISLSIGLLTVIGITVVGWMVYSKIKQQQRLLADKQQQLHKEFHLLMAADLTIDKRLNKLTQATQDLEQNFIAFEDKQQADSTYKQAIKMAEMGASLSDLTSTCSISQAEAELLLHLRGYKLSEKSAQELSQSSVPSSSNN